MLEDGQVRQIIDPCVHMKLNLPLLDLREIPKAECEAEVRRRISEEAQHPFNLAQELPWRISLLRLDEVEHVLVINMHHIVIDEWSMSVFIRELTSLYTAFSAGQPSPLPELPIQYADYAYWQRQRLEGEVLDMQLAYWKQQLGGMLPVLELPTDRSRPPIQSYRGHRCPIVVPKTTYQALQVLSRQEGATLFMILLAAFSVFLYRYTGQEDVVVGCPIAGRAYTEQESLIGCFFNTLVLRTNLSGTPSFREVLQRVRTTSLEAYEHQEVPFEKLVEELHTVRDLSRPPLFQVMFALQNMPVASEGLQMLTLSSVEAESNTAKFDITLSLQETAHELKGYMEYNTDLFDTTTIERMLGHFQNLLEGIADDPAKCIDSLPLLSSAEQQQLLLGWNDTRTVYPKDTCIHQLFEAQVERSRQTVSLIYENEQLTYHELNQRANQVAHYLQSLGVGPEVLVGLCVERSLEMIVGLLGILKAGGAYVPIDPAYPKERIAFVLADAQAPVLLTQHQLLKDLPSYTGRMICLDTDWQAIMQEPRTNPMSGVTADQLAYVIYTSGSTGKPKGVQIIHRAVVNFLHSMSQQPGLTEQDIFLSVTTLSFDIAALEIFLPLITGARVEIASREVVSDGIQLAERLARSGATVMQATPATWQLLLEMRWQGRNGLKTLCGGEALSQGLSHRLLERGASLWNLYGPTETTIWSTIYHVDAKNGVVPIGRPIANTQIYLLDQQLQTVPIGVLGELHIGGDGLARGYRNRPDLTAERFIPHPYSNVPGDRLYMTGDLARYLPDGTIEFLGRIDQQVKIRGFRIEPGEIEAVLSQYASVQQAVVVAREDVLGNKRLVAYVVQALEEESVLSTRDLRGFLQTKLPDYMVPSVFVRLEELPLTPNGKVNRHMLPAPGQTRNEVEYSFVAPRSPLEEVLASIFAEVLGMQRLSVYDNFFEMGGHSLLAARLISRLCETLQVALPLRSIFETPTVAALAEMMLREGDEQEEFEKMG